MRAFKVIFLFALLLVSFIGCGKNQGVAGPTARFDERNWQQSVLSAVKVFDASGNEIVPKDAHGKHPFALFYELSEEDQSANMCGATHLRHSLVLTAAHCLDSYPEIPIENYQIVYFDREGRKQIAPIQSIEYIGDADHIDIAVLRIEPNVANQWDTLGGEIYHSQPHHIGSRIPHTFEVTANVFNPIKHHPSIAKAHPESLAVVFEQKHCMASRTRGEIRLPSGARSPIAASKEWSLAASENVTLDQCSMALFKGNSGSPVTVKGDSQLVSIVSRIDGISPPKNPDRTYYFGNRIIQGMRFPISLTELFRENQKRWKQPNRALGSYQRAGSRVPVKYQHQAFALSTSVEALQRLKPELHL